MNDVGILHSTSYCDQKEYDRFLHAEIMRELRLTTYLLSFSSQTRFVRYGEGEPNRMSLTRACKLLACYVEDWKYLSDSTYPTVFQPKNNPYGIVPVIPEGFRSSISYMYDLDQIAQKYNCWKIHFNDEHRTLEIISSTKDLEDLCTKEDLDKGGGFKDITIDKIRSFAEIYATLDTVELNVLASMRTIYHLKSCLDYAKAAWTYESRKLCDAVNECGKPTPKDSKYLKHMARACQQFEHKVRLFKERQPKLREKLSNYCEEKVFLNSMTNTYLKSIIRSIEVPDENDPLWGIIQKDYSENRIERYKVTKTLIEQFDLYTGIGISREKEYKEMVEDMKKKPVMTLISLSQKSESPDISKVRELQRFEKSWEKEATDATLEATIGTRTDWIITDGEDYSEN